ncbi:hypothetical protein FXO38_06607 [Capsicum annuum]|nr:hypothetical protein FXO38_06607 [Capsicum annuum]
MCITNKTKCRLGSVSEATPEMLSQANSQCSLSISEELATGTVQLKTTKELLDFVQIFDSPYECSNPIELDILLDRIIMFRVNVKQENIESRDRVYGVGKISDNIELIKKYNKSIKENTVTKPHFNVEQPHFNVEKPHFNVEEATDANKVSAYDNEKMSLKKIYIEKRGRPKNGGSVSEVNDDFDQLSSNKAKKVIKKEKNPYKKNPIKFFFQNLDTFF